MMRERFGDVRKYGYGGVAGWEDMHDTDESAEYTLRDIERLLSHVGYSLESAKILEIGTGREHLMRAMQKRGLDVVGVDARPRGGSGAVAAARIEELPFPDAAFDLVIGISVFDHSVYIQNQQAMLQEIKRVLKDGGVLFTTGALIYKTPDAPQSEGFSLVSPSKDDWYQILKKEPATQSERA